MKRLQEVTVSDVRSVYSGKVGKCMCGCAGKHFYASALRVEATKDRGYEVSDDEVNDAMVTKVLRLVQANEEKVDRDGNGAWACFDEGKRTYVIYLREGVQVGVL